MRIALLTAPVTWSGVEVHTIQLAVALQDRGHEVELIEFGRRMYAAAALRHALPRRELKMAAGRTAQTVPSFENLGFRDWRQLLRGLDADVVLAVKGIFKFGSLAMEAAIRERFARFITVEHLHAPLERQTRMPARQGALPRMGLWWYRQKLMGYLRSVFPHKVVCVSRALMNTLVRDYGFPSRKVVTVHNGVDTSVFVPSQHLRAAAREAWQIPPDAFVFGAVGRLSPMKNHTQLINVFADLVQRPDSERDVRLVIIGEGPLRPDLEALAHDRGVAARVIFGGFCEAPQVVYPGFDVLCFPSTTGESLGIVLLESMACGCPAIASAVGGVPEILDDPPAGWLIPMGDASALFEAMQSALAVTPELLSRMGEKARERVQASFEAADRLNDFVKAIEDTFQQVK